jgi:hypothetical protein
MVLILFIWEPNEDNINKIKFKIAWILLERDYKLNENFLIQYHGAFMVRK